MVAVLGVAATAAPPAQAAPLELVSRSTTGRVGDGGSLFPLVSGDGRRVVFASTATNLAPRDTNGESDVLLRDLAARRTVRVSLGLGGRPANGPSYPLAVSASGRFVTFWSLASNLVPGDRNGTWDVFLRDMRTGRVRLVDRGSRGAEANQGAWAGAVVAGGRLAAFQSWASSLAPTGGISQIFLRNLATGRTFAVTRSAAGALGNDESELEAVTPDGRFVAYRSLASNLVAGDTNGTWDVLVRDRAHGRTLRVDVSSAGAQATGGPSGQAAIADDGRLVTFTSTASNLAPNAPAGGLFVHDLATGRTRLLTPSTAQYALAGDGRTVVQSDGAGGLIAIDVATGHRTRLPTTSTTGALLQPSLSRDGRRLAFFSTATDLLAGGAGAVGQVYAARVAAPR